MEVSEPEQEVPNLKDGRASTYARFFPYHYIGSRQNGPLAGRWQMCQTEVVQNQLLSTSDPFKHHNRQIQTTFQSTKIITAVPRRLRPSLRSKQDLCQNTYGDTYKTNPDFFFTA